MVLHEREASIIIIDYTHLNLFLYSHSFIERNDTIVVETTDFNRALDGFRKNKTASSLHKLHPV